MSEKLAVKEKLAYGAGDLASNILFSAISFYLLYFLINVGGLSSYRASVVMIIGKVWDAFANYFAGVIVDKTNTRWGKKRVYMLFGAIPFGGSFILLWVSVPGSETACMAYYTIMYMVVNTCFDIVYIPYNSLAANMTSDYDERTSLNGYRIVLANVGILAGAALFAVFADGKESVFYPVFNSIPKAYLVTSLIFAALAIIIMFVCGFVVKERTDSAPESSGKGLFTTINEFFHLPHFAYIMLTYVCSMVGFDIVMSTFMFFINDSLKFGGGVMAMVFVAIPLVTAIATAAGWVWASEKWDKATVYAVASVYMTIVLIFVIFVPEKNVATTVIITILAGIGMSGIQILPPAAIPDIVEYDEYTNGDRREGALYGIMQFMYKIGSGIFVSLESAVLGAFGYVESTDGTSIEQPKRALMAVRVMLGAVPGCFFLISIIFAFMGKVDRDEFASIKEELLRRHAAKNDKDDAVIDDDADPEQITTAGSTSLKVADSPENQNLE